MSSERHIYLAPWRVDCRLTRELPDDKPVRVRFIFGLVIGVFAAGALTYTTIQAFRVRAAANEISGWEERITDRRAAHDSVSSEQRELQEKMRLIAEAHTLLHPVLPAAGFIGEIAKLRPAAIRLTRISYDDRAATLQGIVRGEADRASRIAGDFVRELRDSKLVSSHFGPATLTALDRADDRGELRFEITLPARDAKP